MNQFRRKSSFTEKKAESVGRPFRPSESSDRKSEGIPEAKEMENREKDSVKLRSGINIRVSVYNMRAVSGFVVENKAHVCDLLSIKFLQTFILREQR